MTHSDISRIIDTLYHAAETYYTGTGVSPLTDDEFDAKLSYVTTSVDHYPDLFEAGTRGAALLYGVGADSTDSQSNTAVSHDPPMLSLDKATTYTAVDTFISTLQAAGASAVTLQAKLDGFAVSVVYNEGTVTRVATRGDGHTGDDMSYVLHSPQLTIHGLPHSLSTTDAFEVRGEVLFTHDQFHRANSARYHVTGDEFKNARNAVAGLVKKAERGLDYPVEMTFVTYAVVNGNVQSITDDGFLLIDDVTQQQVPSLSLTYPCSHRQDIAHAIEQFGVHRSSFTIPTDGVVLKPDNEAHMQSLMGSTAHHPLSHIAFKYPGDTARTTVTHIDTTVGATGKLTPVATIQPVSLSGVSISSVSLHNFNWLHTLDARVGSIVELTRANDVIPYINTVIDNPDDTAPVNTPTTCPACHTTLVAKTSERPPKFLQCPNYRCDSRQLSIIIRAVGKNYLDIDGLSHAILTPLYQSGRVCTIADLFTLTVDELANTVIAGRVLGSSRAQHIVSYIDAATATSAERLVASLGIESLGVTSATTLMRHFGSWDALLNASATDVARIDQFGDTTSRLIVDGLRTVRPVIDQLRAYGVHIQQQTQTSNTLTGLSFSMSGTVPTGFQQRRELVSYIESHGGEVHATPRASTEYMIADPNGTSSKITTAHRYGIPFIHPTEFSQWLAT